jgi:hypothetical protein
MDTFRGHPDHLNLTPMDFAFWGLVKDNVYIPHMSVDLQEHRDRTVNAIVLVGITCMNKLWDELERRHHICRKHNEHLQKYLLVLKMLCNKLCCDITIRSVTIHFQNTIHIVTPSTRYILENRSIQLCIQRVFIARNLFPAQNYSSVELTPWCQNPKVHHRVHKSPLGPNVS